MKRGLVFSSLLLCGTLMLSACREDETLATTDATTSTGSRNTARSGTGSNGGSTGTSGAVAASPTTTGGGSSTPTDNGSTGGGSPTATPTNGGGTTAAAEAVTVIHSAGTTLYVRRGNEEVWIFGLSGDPGAAVGDSFEYRPSDGTFGASGGVLVALSGSGTSYRVVSARRFR